METARARGRTRSSSCPFSMIVAGLLLLSLIASGCAVPQTPAETAPPAASPAVPQPASPAALQPAPATPVPQSATKAPSGAEAQPTLVPPTPASAPAASAVPAQPTVRKSLAASAPAPCSEGDAPTSVDSFPEPAAILDGCVLIGRSLTVNFELVSSWGSSIGEDVVQVKSEGCTQDGDLKYDYVYTVSYACDCPTSLADIPEDASGPGGVVFVGRTLCIDRSCTTEGSTAGTPETESWTCAQHSYDYTRYWTPRNNDVPEASTLLLMAGGLSGLAGWFTLQRRRRKRAE